MVCASRPAARLLRTAAPFELPGWYFGTTRPIIRLVVDLIIRVVLYYQPKADNPADNPAVSFVVARRRKIFFRFFQYLLYYNYNYYIINAIYTNIIYIFLFV